MAVLIADGACNESNDLESIRKRCNHSSSKGEGGSSSASSIVAACSVTGPVVAAAQMLTDNTSMRLLPNAQQPK